MRGSQGRHETNDLTSSRSGLGRPESCSQKAEDKKAWRQGQLLALALKRQPISMGTWTNHPQRLLTLVSDLWPPLRESKPRKLGPNQSAICTQEGPGKEKVISPKGMEMQISATILDSKWFKKMKNVGVRRLLSWHSN